MLQLWHERVHEERLLAQQEEHKEDYEATTFSVATTSDDGEILYSKATIGSQGGK